MDSVVIYQGFVGYIPRIRWLYTKDSLVIYQGFIGYLLSTCNLRDASASKKDKGCKHTSALPEK